MVLVLKTDNTDKMAMIIELANRLVISVKEIAQSEEKPVLPKGKTVATKELLAAFGANSDFLSTEEIRAQTWSSPW